MTNTPRILSLALQTAGVVAIALLAWGAWSDRFEFAQRQVALGRAFGIAGFAGALALLSARRDRAPSLPVLSPARRVAWVVGAMLGLAVLVPCGAAAWLWSQGLGLQASCELEWRLQELLPQCAGIAPIVAVLAWCVPCSRRALLCAGLLALAGAVAAQRALAPGSASMQRLAASPWLLGATALACCAAMVVGLRARRVGGGHARPVGIVVAAICVLPQFALLGIAIVDRRWPDLDTAYCAEVRGVSNDHRALLAWVRPRPGADAVLARVDLDSGRSEQLGSEGSWQRFEAADLLLPGLRFPGLQHDDWLARDRAGNGAIYDLASGRWQPLSSLDPSAEQRASMSIARRAATERALPGGGCCWLGDGGLHFLDGAGETVVPWAGPRGGLEVAGHGILVGGEADRAALFDCVHRRFVRVPPDARLGIGTVAIQGTWLVHGKDGWLVIYGATDRCGPVPALAGCRSFGALGGDAALLLRNRGDGRAELFAFRPAAGELLPIALPAECAALHFEEPTNLDQPWLRDASGAPWLTVACGRDAVLLRVDPESRAARCMLRGVGVAVHELRVIAFESARSCLVQTGDRIVRLDCATGTQQSLLPRAEPAIVPAPR